jgi:hypothetical protein
MDQPKFDNNFHVAIEGGLIVSVKLWNLEPILRSRVTILQRRG